MWLQGHEAQEGNSPEARRASRRASHCCRSAWVPSTRKSANAASSSRSARRSVGASVSTSRPSRRQITELLVFRDVKSPRFRGGEVSPDAVHPLPGRSRATDGMQTLQHVQRAGDRAAARQQRLAQVGDRLVSWLAHQQVAEHASDHRRKRVATGVEAAQVVGECDLFIAWHTPVIAHITQMTQISVISVSDAPERQRAGRGLSVWKPAGEPEYAQMSEPRLYPKPLGGFDARPQGTVFDCGQVEDLKAG